MTISEATTLSLSQRQGQRATRAKRERGALEELATEVQARVDEQIADHGAMSHSIITEQGRDAVTDRLFDRAVANARYAVDHGSRDDQLAALERVERTQRLDEAAEEAFLAALLSALGIHNVDANDLRRLVHVNTPAIVNGHRVELDVQLPAHLVERQKAGRR